MTGENSFVQALRSLLSGSKRRKTGDEHPSPAAVYAAPPTAATRPSQFPAKEVVDLTLDDSPEARPAHKPVADGQPALPPAWAQQPTQAPAMQLRHTFNAELAAAPPVTYMAARHGTTLWASTPQAPPGSEQLPVPASSGRSETHALDPARALPASGSQLPTATTHPHLFMRAMEEATRGQTSRPPNTSWGAAGGASTWAATQLQQLQRQDMPLQQQYPFPVSQEILQPHEELERYKAQVAQELQAERRTQALRPAHLRHTPHRQVLPLPRCPPHAAQGGWPQPALLRRVAQAGMPTRSWQQQLVQQQRWSAAGLWGGPATPSASPGSGWTMPLATPALPVLLALQSPALARKQQAQQQAAQVAQAPSTAVILTASQAHAFVESDHTVALALQKHQEAQRKVKAAEARMPEADAKVRAQLLTLRTPLPTPAGASHRPSFVGSMTLQPEVQAFRQQRGALAAQHARRMQDLGEQQRQPGRRPSSDAPAAPSSSGAQAVARARAPPAVEHMELVDYDEEDQVVTVEQQQQEEEDGEVLVVEAAEEEPEPREAEGAEAEEEEEEMVEEQQDEWTTEGDLGIPANTPEELEAYLATTTCKVADVNQVVVTHQRSNIPLTWHSLRTLADRTWLNDEVINASMGILQERDWDWSANNHALRPARCFKSHFFSTFFLNKLYKDKGIYQYKEVQRWTRAPKLSKYGQAQKSVLHCERIFFPVHVGTSHWAAACVDVRMNKLHYWDSMLTSPAPQPVLAHLAQWVLDEARDKLPTDEAQRFADAPKWPRLVHPEVPQQANGVDCGVFAITFIAFASTGRPFSFSQADMPTVRRRLLSNLLKLQWSLT